MHGLLFKDCRFVNFASHYPKIMKYILAVLLLCSQVSVAQKISKADKKTIKSLQLHINYLSDDKLEGRRTGSAGEKLAYEYISTQFKNAGITPNSKSTIEKRLNKLKIYFKANNPTHLVAIAKDLGLV